MQLFAQLLVLLLGADNESDELFLRLCGELFIGQVLERHANVETVSLECIHSVTNSHALS